MRDHDRSCMHARAQGPVVSGDTPRSVVEAIRFINIELNKEI